MRVNGDIELKKLIEVVLDIEASVDPGDWVDEPCWYNSPFVKLIKAAREYREAINPTK